MIILFAAGCKKQKNESLSPPSAPSSYSSDIKINYNELEMTAQLTQNSAEDFSIQFITPSPLAPLLLSYKDGSCTVNYGELTFETELDRFPQAEIGALIIHSISDAIQGIDIKATCLDGIWTYKGTGERGSFSLTRDAETGAWLELYIEGADLKVIFSNFEIK